MVRNLLVLSFLLVSFILSQSTYAEVNEIVFIVNIKNTANEVTVSSLRDYYFKRKRQWPNGESIRFIDRANGSNVRNIFLKDVLNKSSSEVDLFWIGQKLYKGDSAPLRENSDSTTEQFVASFPGAIGYVSPTTILNSKSVKVIKVTDE